MKGNCSSSAYRLIPFGFLFDLLFDPEYGGDMLLRNVRLTANYMALTTVKMLIFNEGNIN
jgi:hypothetical protein